MSKDITSNSLEYHENTKHSEISVMTSPHYLDWNNRPYPFKIYTDLDSIPLPSDFPLPSMNAILAINKSTFQYKHQDQDKDKSEHDIDNVIGTTKTKSFTLKDLAEILFFSAGITREIKYNDNNIIYMRAASATGALYPIEVYVVCKDIAPNLKAGVYHFSPAQFGLTKIRNGDYTSLLASIVSSDVNQVILNSDLTIILTSYAWRNAWKYQDRSYRHWFWDSGVIAANLIAIISSMENNTSAKIHLGFIDDKVNQLLALEKDKEATVAIISLNVKPSSSNSNRKANSTTIEKLVGINLPRTIPLSKKEQKFPLIWKTHDRSKLFTIEEVKEWTKVGVTQIINNPISSNKTIIKRQYLTNEYQQQQQQSNIPSIGETILKRGSTRKFSRTCITFSNLSSILYNSTREISMDYKKDKESLIDIYLILNDVKGIDSGGYFYNRLDNSLDLIKDKVSREMSAYLCLGQSLFGDASAVLFLMSDLSKTNKILGNRGYRAAQFESGVIAGNIYLLAYAHAIGASGSTFYDDAVTELFSPHAENKNTMIVVGIGNPDYKSRSGKILPVKFSKEQLLEKTKYITG